MSRFHPRWRRTRVLLGHFGAADSAQTLYKPFGQPEDSIPAACACARARVGYCAGLGTDMFRGGSEGLPTKIRPLPVQGRLFGSTSGLGHVGTMLLRGDMSSGASFPAKF